MIDPKEMLALWNTDEDTFQVREFLIVRQADQDRSTDQYLASAGACDQGWLERDSALHTPLGLYAHLATAYGFPNREMAIAVLREFQKVKGQQWAGELLDGAGVHDD